MVEEASIAIGKVAKFWKRGVRCVGSAPGLAGGNHCREDMSCFGKIRCRKVVMGYDGDDAIVTIVSLLTFFYARFTVYNK